MTEDQNGVPPQIKESGKKENITIISSFCCPACTTGGEKYDDVFDGGNCRKCGQPLEEFEATITEVGMDTLKKSVIVVSSKDIDKEVDQMIEELKENGINAIKASEIVEGVQISDAAENLAFVIRNTAYTFVVPSQGLDGDKIAKACLNDVLFNSEKEMRIVPVYIKEDSYDYLSSFFKGYIGCDWNNFKESRWSVPKEKLFKDVGAEIGQGN